MAAITPFIATRARNFFNTAFKRLNGVAQVATIEDLNKIGSVVNTIASNQSYSITNHIRVTQGPLPGGELIFASVTGGGNVVCIDNCLHTDQGLKDQFCCGATQAYGINGKAIASATSAARTAPGTFTITFPENRVDATGVMANTWLDTVVTAGNLGLPGFVLLTKVSNTEYTLVTLDAAGVPADGLLNNTVLQFTGYLRPNGWSNPN